MGYFNKRNCTLMGGGIFLWPLIYDIVKKTMYILNSCSTRICNAYKLWFSPKITLFWDFTQKLGATTTSITRASFSQWDISSFFERRVTVPTAANIATNTFVLFQSEKKDIMTYARNIFAPLRLFKGKGSPSSADAQGEKEFSWQVLHEKMTSRSLMTCYVAHTT